MDTRSKKFDGNILVKTICVILAIACVMGSVAIGIKWYFKIGDLNEEEIDETYVENIITQGKDFNLETSEMFKKQLRRFSFLSYRQALIFKNSNKSAYNEHEKTISKLCEKYVSEKENDIILKIENESDQSVFYHTFYYYDLGFVSLEKIANNKDQQKGSFYYNGGSYYFSVDDDIEYSEEDLEEYIDDEDTDYEDTARQTKATVDIPQSIKDKAGKYDTIVKINSCYYGDDEIFFDGYYKVTLNKENIGADYLDRIINSYNNSVTYNPIVFNSFDSFSNCAAENKKELSEYKSLYYAVYFKNSGEVITNHPDLKSNSTQNKVKNVFSKYAWNWYIDRESDAVVLSEEIKQYSEKDSAYYDTLLIDPFNSATLSSDSFLTDEQIVVYMAYDSSSKDEDIISSIEEKYVRIYNELRSDFILAACMIVLFLVCLVILVAKSGRKNGDSEIHMLKSDKLYTSFKFILNGGIIALGVTYILYGIFDFLPDLTGGKRELMTASIVICSGAVTAVLIDFLLYVSRHIKNHTLLKNLMIGRFLSFISNRIRIFAQTLEDRPEPYKDIFNDVLKKFVFRLILPNVLFALASFFFMCIEIELFGVFILGLLVVYDLLAFGYIIRYFYSLRIVFYNLNQMRNGNNNVHIDTQRMPSNIKAYAEDLNAIGDGLKIAVENAVREEKTKTELITNVSHDLKTPLTSIITYVDLLSRCGISDEEARGYIEVLLEKSAKLKRLIEDLVEASKASTGNISVELIEVSLNELIMQIVGEYEDEFSEKDLQIVLDDSQKDITVYADSKLCYRVLDNLMNNIKKYALASTRVYISVSNDDSYAEICFKNISENPLNIPASELLQRFVRGDASRSGDGNGLGLSIAENLCSLQGGKLTLEINGDLFIAKAKFRLKK